MTVSQDSAGGGAAALVRIDRGSVTAEATAAVVLAILAVQGRAAAARPAPAGPDRAGWLRLERTVAFRPGHSWRRVARVVEPSCAGY